MEVTCIYCKHYPTCIFGNETRLPGRASLQLEVSSGAKAFSSPTFTENPNFLWITLYVLQTGWGKGSLAQTSDEAYSQVLLTRRLLLGKEKFKPSSLLRPKEQPQTTFKRKGWVRFKPMYPAVCIKEQHQLEGISLS